MPDVQPWTLDSTVAGDPFSGITLWPFHTPPPIPPVCSTVFHSCLLFSLFLANSEPAGKKYNKFSWGSGGIT